MSFNNQNNNTQGYSRTIQETPSFTQIQVDVDLEDTYITNKKSLYAQKIFEPLASDFISITDIDVIPTKYGTHIVPLSNNEAYSILQNLKKQSPNSIINATFTNSPTKIITNALPTKTRIVGYSFPDGNLGAALKKATENLKNTGGYILFDAIKNGITYTMTMTNGGQIVPFDPAKTAKSMTLEGLTHGNDDPIIIDPPVSCCASDLDCPLEIEPLGDQIPWSPENPCGWLGRSTYCHWFYTSTIIHNDDRTEVFEDETQLQQQPPLPTNYVPCRDPAFAGNPDPTLGVWERVNMTVCTSSSSEEHVVDDSFDFQIEPQDPFQTIHNVTIIAITKHCNKSVTDYFGTGCGCPGSPDCICGVSDVCKGSPNCVGITFTGPGSNPNPYKDLGYDPLVGACQEANHDADIAEENAKKEWNECRDRAVADHEKCIRESRERFDREVEKINQERDSGNITQKEWRSRWCEITEKLCREKGDSQPPCTYNDDSSNYPWTPDDDGAQVNEQNGYCWRDNAAQEVKRRWSPASIVEGEQYRTSNEEGSIQNNDGSQINYYGKCDEEYNRKRNKAKCTAAKMCGSIPEMKKFCCLEFYLDANKECREHAKQYPWDYDGANIRDSPDSILRDIHYAFCARKNQEANDLHIQCMDQLIREFCETPPGRFNPCYDNAMGDLILQLLQRCKFYVRTRFFGDPRWQGTPDERFEIHREYNDALRECDSTFISLSGRPPTLNENMNLPLID